MENTRTRFISAQLLNIFAYLLIITATYIFSNYEFYWLEFLFETDYGLCVLLADLCATAAFIIGFFFREKRGKRFLYKLSWAYLVVVGVETMIALPTMFISVINIFIGIATGIAAALQFIAGLMINNYSER